MAVRWGSLRGPQALVLYALGLVAVFVGERLVGGQDLARWLVSGSGAAAVLLATSAFCLAWLRSTDDARRVEHLVFLLALLGVAALVIYALGSDLLGAPARTIGKDRGPGLAELLRAIWPILLVCAVIPMIFVQWSLASMSRGSGIEIGRVHASAGSGARMALLLSTLFVLNALADRIDVHGDLSYFRTTSPSDSTRSLVTGLAEDTKALLFFPAANDVLSETEPYFEELAELSPRFTAELVDRALEPELAREHRVSREGTVVLVRGGKSQKIELGDELKRAKRKLRKLDSEFQTAMLKLTYKRQVVYLLTGHEERGERRREGDPRPRISLLKKHIESKNFTVKQLGVMEGLTDAVPDDAALVIWAGPRQGLIPGELGALETYLERGGRMLVLLDPEAGAEPGADLLAWLGLEFDPVRLAHDRYFIPFTGTRADWYAIGTNTFSSHGATTWVSQHSQEVAIVFPTTGSLGRAKESKDAKDAKGAKGKATPRLRFIVRTRENAWADRQADLLRGDDEPRKQFQIAAAISRKTAQGTEADKPKAKKASKEDERSPAGEEKAAEAEKKAPDVKAGRTEPLSDEMRVVVFADADVFADPFFYFRGGNHRLFTDVLDWLLGEGRAGGATTREEDVPIVHTRAEDVYWFYGTVFAVPLLVLGLGMLTRWGRGREKGRRS
ncbi:MAG: Gldg family protein [Deltaproteobacteria bacterium]|nr:Gldg family protein [Deltaproteobacteria bacterium]